MLLLPTRMSTGVSLFDWMVIEVLILTGPPPINHKSSILMGLQSEISAILQTHLCSVVLRIDANAMFEFGAKTNNCYRI